MSRARDTADQINRVNSSAADATAITVDSSENVLIGKTSADGTGSTGHDIRATGLAYHTVDGGDVKVLNRLNSDGSILSIRKDGTTVGSIGTTSGDSYFAGAANHSGIRFQETSLLPLKNGASSNGDIDLGYNDGVTTLGFRNLTLSGGIYLGGVGSANKLEDYEEGTWTPVLGSVSHTNAGKYVKVGNLCFLSIGNQTGSAIADGGNFTITGLPFSVIGWEWTSAPAITWADASSGYQQRVATARQTNNHGIIVYNRGGVATTTSDPWNVSLVYRIA